MDVWLITTLRHNVNHIETNKPTWQQTTIDYDYVAPASYEGRHHKVPAKGLKSRKLSDSIRTHHCLLPFFQKLSTLLMNCGIYFVFIPGITIPGITIPGIFFLLPRLNNSVYPRVNYPWDRRFIPWLQVLFSIILPSNEQPGPEGFLKW